MTIDSLKGQGPAWISLEIFSSYPDAENASERGREACAEDQWWLLRRLELNASVGSGTSCSRTLNAKFFNFTYFFSISGI